MVAKRSDSTKEHWQSVYSSKSAQEVGWFQAQHEVSIEFINNSEIAKDARILDVGSGATTLLDDLLKEGYSNIMAMDISASALAVSKQRLADLITWEVADITHPLDIEDRIPELKEDFGSGMCNITRCCTDVCPENINLTDNGIIPLKERVIDRYYDPLTIIGRKLFGKKKKKLPPIKP
jgi:SAM-dependent methyltransferase